MFHDYSFTVKMDVAEDILDYRTLNLILQPLAENAIAHGIDRRRGSEPGVITISGRRDGDCVVLSVADNGVGMEQEEADHSDGEEQRLRCAECQFQDSARIRRSVWSFD